MDNHLTWNKHGDAVIFRFHGSIESDLTSDLKQTIMSTLSKERADIAVFHMGDATYIDSMGIGMFVHLHVQHHERIKFVFCDLGGNVSQAFGYVKLISFFEIRDTLDQALQELGLA